MAGGSSPLLVLAVFDSLSFTITVNYEFDFRRLKSMLYIAIRTKYERDLPFLGKKPLYRMLHNSKWRVHFSSETEGGMHRSEAKSTGYT